MDDKRKAVGFVVTAPARELHIVADSEREATAWHAALLAAIAAAGLSSSGGSAGGGGGDTLDGSAAAAASSLPQAVEVDGTPEVGCDLRVRLANSRLLDSLCVAWFRFSGGGEEPSPLADVAAHPSTRVISGATGATYTVTELDLGYRLGCIVRPVSGVASRWSLLAARVRSSGTSSAPWLHLSVMPHEHHKYCDRRVRVCTAAGMHREGNVLAAGVRGRLPAAAAAPAEEAGACSGVPAGYKLVWYRSDVVEGRQLGSAGAAASAQEDAADMEATGVTGAAAAAAGYARSPRGEGTALASLGSSFSLAAAAAAAGGGGRGGPSSPRPPSGPACPSPAPGSPALRPGETEEDDEDEEGPAPQHSGSTVANPRCSRIWRHLPRAVYRRIRPRPLDSLPTPPPDHAPSPPISELQRQLAAMQLPRGRAAAASPGAGAGGSGGGGGSAFYPLCRDDVGRLLCAALMLEGAAEPDVLAPASGGSGGVAALPSDPSAHGLGAADGSPVPGLVAVSLPAGPIDAAPPKAREIWIEGPQTVGSLLLGRALYFGGYEGPSVVSWISITEEGDTVELKPPTACPPLAVADEGAFRHGRQAAREAGGQAVHEPSATGRARPTPS